MQNEYENIPTFLGNTPEEGLEKWLQYKEQGIIFIEEND